MGHVLSPRLLLSVLFALVALTAATVFVTSIDLGSQGNLVVAMVIATVKAALVATYFMHLRWDRRFNLLVFLSGVLFLILFLSMTLTDRREYQDAIDRLERTQARQAAP
jgi:cytochrome c oxidase subunit 4